MPFSNNTSGGGDGSRYTFRATDSGSGNWNTGGAIVGTGNIGGGQGSAGITPYSGNIMAGLTGQNSVAPVVPVVQPRIARVQSVVQPRAPGQPPKRQPQLQAPIPSYINPSNYGPGNPRPMFPSSPTAPRPLSDYGPGTNHGGFRPYLGPQSNTRGINPLKGISRGINPMTQEPIGGSRYQSMWSRGPIYNDINAGMYNGSIPFIAPQTRPKKEYYDRVPEEYTSGGGGGGGGGGGW